MNRFKCIPNYNHLITIKLFKTYVEPNVTFCIQEDRDEIDYMNKVIIKICDKYCLISCVDNQYDYEFSATNELLREESLFPFSFRDEYYIKYIYSEKTLFIKLLIDLINILSLWHGINIIQIIKYIYILFNTLRNQITIIDKIWDFII